MIISLNSVNQLIFEMVKCGVFFVVRTEFLNIIYTSFGFKGLMSTKILNCSCLIILKNTGFASEFFAILHLLKMISILIIAIKCIRSYTEQCPCLILNYSLNNMIHIWFNSQFAILFGRVCSLDWFITSNKSYKKLCHSPINHAHMTADKNCIGWIELYDSA
jgi:hypothetical protein